MYYTVTHPIRHDGTRYTPGSSIELPPEQAAPHLKSGVLCPAIGVTVTADVNANALADIIAALHDSAPHDKKPTVAALAKQLGRDLSADERDAAWAQYQDEARQ